MTTITIHNQRGRESFAAMLEGVLEVALDDSELDRAASLERLIAALPADIPGSMLLDPEDIETAEAVLENLVDFDGIDEGFRPTDVTIDKDRVL